MLKNIIAITTYSNPDLLWIYLEQLCKSPSINNYKIKIFTEPGFDNDINNVVSEYSHLDISIKIRERHPTCPLVGFHNIIKSYEEAANVSPEYFILGEDDLLPVAGALEFYEDVYEKFLSKHERLFCLAHKRRPETEATGNPNVLIGDYQLTSPSIMTSYHFVKYVKPHICDELFDNPVLYYRKHFYDCRIQSHEHTHWDGFMERCMLKARMFALKPDQTRSCHVGLRGIHSKGNAPSGTLEEKVSEYKRLIKNGDLLRSLSNTPEDLVVADLKKRVKYDRLVLDIHRNLNKASSFWYDKNNEFKQYLDVK